MAIVAAMGTTVWLCIGAVLFINIAELYAQGDSQPSEDDKVMDLFQRLDEKLTHITEALDEHNERLDDLQKKLAMTDARVTDTLTILSYLTEPKLPTACAQLQEEGHKENGVYTIRLVNGSSFNAYCNMTTLGGGWTVIQRRMDGAVEFYNRTWEEYATGFGDMEFGDHWLGLRHVYSLTKHQPIELYVGVDDYEKGPKYIIYKTFWVASEEDKFRLSIGDPIGDGGDSLRYTTGFQFSTKEQDNDIWARSCSEEKKGAWWYKRCGESNLNGPFGTRNYWYMLRHNYGGVKNSIMMIRPRDYR